MTMMIVSAHEGQHQKCVTLVTAYSPQSITWRTGYAGNIGSHVSIFTCVVNSCANATPETE